jgi:WD40 repeat protein
MSDVEAQPLPVGYSAYSVNSINVVAFSSTGSQFIFDNGYSTIHLYDIQSRGCRGQIKIEGSVVSSAFSPNNQQIAIGTSEGVIYLWDKRSEEPCAILEGHEDEVNCIAYSPCGQWIVSGSNDHTVGIWHRRLSGEVESWSKAHSIRAFSNYIYKVAWNPVVPMEFVAGTGNGTVQVWRMSVGESGDIAVRMVWGPHLDILCTEGAIFANAKGLDPIYQKLFVQRGTLT